MTDIAKLEAVIKSGKVEKIWFGLGKVVVTLDVEGLAESLYRRSYDTWEEAVVGTHKLLFPFEAAHPGLPPASAYTPATPEERVDPKHRKDFYGYPSSPVNMYVLRRNGEPIMSASEGRIWDYLHASHACSVWWALKYEGYTITPVDPTAEEIRRLTSSDSK